MANEGIKVSVVTRVGGIVVAEKETAMEMVEVLPLIRAAGYGADLSDDTLTIKLRELTHPLSDDANSKDGLIVTTLTFTYFTC